MVFRLAHEGLALQVIKLDGTLSIKFTPATKRSMNFTFEGTDTEETQQTKDARRKGSGELFQIPGLEIVLEEFLGKLELSLKSPKYGGMSMSFDGPLKQERKEIEIIDLEEDMDGEVKIEEQETLPANDSEQVGPSAVAEAEEVAEQMPSSSPARPKQRPSRRTSRSSDDDDDDSTSDGSHDDTSSPNHFDTLEGPVQIAEADHDYLSYWHVYLEGYHVGPTAYPDRPEFCAVDDTEPSGNLGRLHLDLADNVIYWEEPCADKDGRLQIKTPRLEWATMHECKFRIKDNGQWAENSRLLRDLWRF
jgi:hypothetical protein